MQWNWNQGVIHSGWGKMGGYYMWWMHDAAKCLSIFE